MNSVPESAPQGEELIELIERNPKRFIEYKRQGEDDFVAALEADGQAARAANVEGEKGHIEEAQQRVELQRVDRQFNLQPREYMKEALQNPRQTINRLKQRYGNEDARPPDLTIRQRELTPNEPSADEMAELIKKKPVNFLRYKQDGDSDEVAALFANNKVKLGTQVLFEQHGVKSDSFKNHYRRYDPSKRTLSDIANFLR